MPKLSLLLLFFTLLGCSKPPDLESPCPDYGRHCLQFAINDETLGEKQ